MEHGIAGKLSVCPWVGIELSLLIFATTWDIVHKQGLSNSYPSNSVEEERMSSEVGSRQRVVGG
jgi:hypothetical protein